jgi:hypothetical protein
MLSLSLLLPVTVASQLESTVVRPHGRRAGRVAAGGTRVTGRRLPTAALAAAGFREGRGELARPASRSRPARSPVSFTLALSYSKVTLRPEGSHRLQNNSPLAAS